MAKEPNISRMIARSMAKPPKRRPQRKPKAASVPVPLSAERLDALDTWRASRHMTRAEAIDELVCQALRMHEFVGRMKR